MTDQSTASALLSLSLTEARPLPEHLPVTLTRSFFIQDQPTDCFVQLFQDQVIVGLSQLDGKIGTWISCEMDNNQVLMGKPSFTVQTLLGSSAEGEVYARRFTEQLASLRASTADSMPAILLGISLQKNCIDNAERFHHVVETLVKLYQDAIQLVAT